MTTRVVGQRKEEIGEKRDKVTNRAPCASQKATHIDTARNKKPLTIIWDSQVQSAFHTNRIAYLFPCSPYRVPKWRRRQLGEFILSPDGFPDRCMESMGSGKRVSLFESVVVAIR
jgi:hypothetical protein